MMSRATASSRPSAPGEPEVAPAQTLAAPSSRVMSRSLGLLFVCGALVGLLWTWLPGPNAQGDDLIVVLTAAVALAAGVLMLEGVTDRMPPAVFHGVLGAMQILITIVYVASGDPADDARLAYVWTTPFACFFFRRLYATLHLLFAGALLALGLGALDSPLGPGARIFTITYGTLLAVGALVMWVAAAIRASESQLDRAATHDPLTGLANRTLFARRAAEALDRRAEHGGSVFVVLADLDRFKMVNDTQGHHAGDALLTALAPRILRAAPAGSTVARMGGDEFAVLVEDRLGALRPDDVVELIAAAWREPVRSDRGLLHTSASLGISVASNSDTPSSLLRDADAAMYKAKRQGPGSAKVFDGDHRAEIRRRFALEQALHRAVERGELHVVFQPIVDLTSGRAHAAEVLVRWTSPELGVVSPDELIPVAEETGLIVPIGDWVIEQATHQLATWRREGLVDDGFGLTVNVSSCQFSSAFVDTVVGALRTHGIPAENLMLELTESVLLDANTVTSAVLADLVSSGVPLVLDDFGTGYSSLSYLQRARFDAVKVDRMFVAGVEDDGTARSIITGIVALADALFLDVVAEGVETEAHAAALRAMGCRFAQGYLFDRPLTAEEYTRRLTAGQVPGERLDAPPSRQGSASLYSVGADAR